MTEYSQLKIDDIEVDEVGNVTVVRFCEHRITDLLEIEKLGQTLYALAQQRVRPKLVLDFSEVAFFSSAAIGKLISLSGKVKTHGGMMKLCGLQPAVLEVFQVCKLETVFDIRQDRPDAMLSFSQ